MKGVLADTRFMENRMEPDVIVGTVRAESPAMLVTAKVSLGIAFALFEAVTLFPVFGWFGVGVAVCAGTAAGWFGQGITILRLQSEFRGRLSQPEEQRENKEFTARAGSLKAGVWITETKDYEQRQREHRRREAEQQRRYQLECTRWEELQRTQQELLAAGDRPADPLPPKPEKPQGLPLPKHRFLQVIAVRRHAGLVEIAFRGARSRSILVDEQTSFACLKKSPGRIGEPGVAAAFEDLVRDARYEPDEDRLIDGLVSRGHEQRHIRDAMRAALATGLIVCEGPVNRIASETVRMFQRSGPPKRILSLTGSGAVWVRVRPSGPSTSGYQ